MITYPLSLIKTALKKTALKGRVLSVLAAAVLVLGAATTTAEETIDFPGLQALMTDAEFAQTGLKKLSPKERAALNRWLAARGRFKLEVTEAPVAKQPAPQSSTPGASKNPASSESAPAGTEPAPQAKRVVAKRLKRSERTSVKPIRTRIVGKFKGWSGSTLFALENGQYWKQRQPGRYYYKAESPEVELFKNRLGFWEIKILATGKTVKVSRFEP